MSAVKKPECKDIKPDNTLAQKIEIERMKKIIQEKIRDPALARKAAMIISEMLDKK